MRIIKFAMQRNQPRAHAAARALATGAAFWLRLRRCWPECQASPEGYALPTAVPGAVATSAPVSALLPPDPTRTPPTLRCGVPGRLPAPWLNPIPVQRTRDIISLNTLVL